MQKIPIIQAELKRILFLKILLAAYATCKTLVRLRVGERGHCFQALGLPVVMLHQFLNYISTKSEVKETALRGWGGVIYFSYWALSKSSRMSFYLLLLLHTIYIVPTCHVAFIIYVIKLVFGIQTWDHGMNFKKVPEAKTAEASVVFRKNPHWLQWVLWCVQVTHKLRHVTSAKERAVSVFPLPFPLSTWILATL